MHKYLLVAIELTHSNLDPHSKKLLLHFIRAENEQGHPRKRFFAHYPLHNLQNICNKTLPRTKDIILLYHMIRLEPKKGIIPLLFDQRTAVV